MNTGLIIRYLLSQILSPKKHYVQGQPQISSLGAKRTSSAFSECVNHSPLFVRIFLSLVAFLFFLSLSSLLSPLISFSISFRFVRKSDCHADLCGVGLVLWGLRARNLFYYKSSLQKTKTSHCDLFNHDARSLFLLFFRFFAMRCLPPGRM